MFGIQEKVHRSSWKPRRTRRRESAKVWSHIPQKIKILPLEESLSPRVRLGCVLLCSEWHREGNCRGSWTHSEQQRGLGAERLTIWFTLWHSLWCFVSQSLVDTKLIQMPRAWEPEVNIPHTQLSLVSLTKEYDTNSSLSRIKVISG